MKRLFLLATGLVAASIATSPAFAQSARTFVSGRGSDTGACQISAPCRTIAFALTQTAINGEVFVLDSAGYGGFTISQSVSIINQSAIAGITATTGNAITISAGSSSNITLRGLIIEGTGTATSGIVFNSGASLTVDHCVVQNFTGDGISLQPTSGTVNFLIINTKVLGNGGSGINYGKTGSTATVKGTIDNTVASNNVGGIGISGLGTGATSWSLSNIVASNNSNNNIALGQISSGSLIATIDLSYISGGAAYGIFAGGGKIYLSRNVVQGNVFGIAGGSQTIYSYGDNRINGNDNDIRSGTTVLTAAPQ